ncbi:MAG: DUF167 domain-containing protein [Desulfocapsaceae bacterium]|nr:DUF167 domain-containing protein [Desulfocapsaceae bacterium]
MPFLSRLADGRSLLAIYVQPRSSRNGLVCIHDQAIKLALTSPPVDDAANKALISFFLLFSRFPASRLFSIKGNSHGASRLLLRG